MAFEGLASLPPFTAKIVGTEVRFALYEEVFAEMG